MAASSFKQLIMHFTHADLSREFDPGTFARGEAYARQGKVRHVMQDGRYIVGEVSGSGGQIYNQIIRLKTRRASVLVEGECTCPMAYNCKHVVAVMLERLQRVAARLAAKPGAEAAPDALDDDTGAWLAGLADAIERAATPPAPRATHSLIYALTPDPVTGTPHVNIAKARIRKDGGFSSATMANEPFTLLSSKVDYVQPHDEEFIRLIAALNSGRMYVDDVPLSGHLGARLMARLVAAEKLLWSATRADLKRGAVSTLRAGPPRQGALGWHAADADPADAADTVDPADQAIALRWRFDDGAAIGHVLATEPMMYVNNGEIGELTLPPMLTALPPVQLLRMAAESPRLRPSQRAAMASKMLEQGLERLLPLPAALTTRRRDDIAPTFHLLLDCKLPDANAHYWPMHSGQADPGTDYAQLTITYDGTPVPASRESAMRRMVDSDIEEIERDLHAERAAGEHLAALGFTPTSRASQSHMLDKMQLPAPADWLRFVRQQLPGLIDAGWHISFGPDYRYDFQEVDDWYAELNDDEADAVNPWFALELGILVDGRRHALLPLLLQMIRRAPADFSDAAIAAQDDDAELLVELDEHIRVALPWRRIKPILSTLSLMYFTERDGLGWRLPLMDAARLAELEQAAQLRWVGGERLRELGRKLHSFEGIRQVDAPAGLQAQLRPYQLAGLAWMQFLREYEFAGILADDMGLGKTIQTLAHILAEKEAGRLDRPALVVAPTSLMSNWQSEAARFAPGLRVLLLHGKDRAPLFERIADADLVLTTYPLLARDETLLRAQQFHLLILDEAQYIKNSKAKMAQAARLLTARHRLCLTGTPVQNHLGELWSQFHFLMPGLLGDEKTFNAMLRKPIELYADAHARDILARRIKPFMLRRTKDKVATELPPKTEIMLPVDFGPGQRDLYETVRVAMDKKVRDEIDRRGLARSQIVILDALLKLRQVCCDPRLLKKIASNAGSAKLDTLMELLDTLWSEGRKVLVFSQFTSMLALIAEQLEQRLVEFALLTGDTVDRAAQVNAFQSGQVGVFLISLKAGGVGLNLTAADTVIHYDPWWNPAAENQATDRAWRIGQTQPVFVYKLIARGTLEEKIQEMQIRKGTLASAVLDPEAGLAQAIGAEDLQAIFAPIAVA